MSRWLRHFTLRTVTRFQARNAAVVRQLLPTLGLRTWTVDVAGVVVSTGLQVERAARGYNPHQRKVPSYYPIMAHLAETTHILRVKHRSGNVHDGKAGLPFLRALWPQLVGLRTGGARLRFRMDGAFFRQDVLRWLQGRGVGSAIKVPFYRWLDLQRYIRDSPTWLPVAPGVTGFAVPGAETPWHIPVTVTISRKKVPHRATTNYQLDMAKLVIEVPEELRGLGEAFATMVARVQGTVAGTRGGTAVDYGPVEQTIAEEAGGIELAAHLTILEALDVDVPTVIIGGLRYTKVGRCEAPYHTLAGSVSSDRCTASRASAAGTRGGGWSTRSACARG